ncbi:MAG: DUF4190 domain-containing protein [Lachnospiraceae bacterium]|nr:DUF4190 domain-containing protein [Lachnospiraceae bacterium]
MSDKKGIDTSGLNEDTFKIGESYLESQNNSQSTSEDLWSGESTYSTPTWSSEATYSTSEQSDANTYHTSTAETSVYSAPTYHDVGVQQEKKGQGLEITALVFGILGLVMCCCNGFFGFVGLILSIVALAKGRRNGKTIAALICSIIGLMIGLIMFVAVIMDEEVQEGFWEGFEQGYESTSGQDIDLDFNDDVDDSTSEDYSEPSVETHEGTDVVSDTEAGKVILEGNEITVPCKLSDVLKYYEVSSYNDDVMNNGLEAYATEIIYLAKNGVENGVYVAVTNNTEQPIKDVKEATVSSIDIDTYGERPIESASVFKGISLGMSSTEVETALEGIQYNRNDMDGYVGYSITAGTENDYYFTIMLSDDKVYAISLYYYGS